MNDDLDDLELVKTKSNTKCGITIGCLIFIIPLIAFVIYLSPIAAMWVGVTQENISNKLNTHQNITEIIDDSSKHGARIKKEDNNMIVSWDMKGSTLQKLKYASNKDIERLAKSFYTETGYDKCKVKKQEFGIEYDVNFYRKESLVYTVTFTGN